MGGAGSSANLSVGVDPLTTNRYTYVNGDPVNYSDPSGHGPCPETGQRPNGIEQQGGSPTTCVIENPDAPGGHQITYESDAPQPPPAPPDQIAALAGSGGSWWKKTFGVLGELIPFRGCWRTITTVSMLDATGRPTYDRTRDGLSCGLDLTFAFGSIAARPVSRVAGEALEAGISRTLAAKADEVAELASRAPRVTHAAADDIRWPANHGFDGRGTTNLLPGARIDRYGPETGRFVSPEGVPIEVARCLGALISATITPTKSCDG